MARVRKASPRQVREIVIKCNEVAARLAKELPRGVRGVEAIRKIAESGMSRLVTDRMLELHQLRESGHGSRARNRAVGAGVARRSAWASGVQQEFLREAGLTETPTYPTQTMTESVAAGSLDPGRMDVRSHEPLPQGHGRQQRGDIRDRDRAGGHPAAKSDGPWLDPMKKYDDSSRIGGVELGEIEDGLDPEGRKVRLQGDEDEMRMSETHDPEAEESALRSADSALSDLVDAFAGDPADESYADTVNEWRSTIASWLQDLGAEGYATDNAGSEDEEEDNPLTRGEDELEKAGMHMAEPEDEDEMEPGSMGPHDDLFADDLAVPKMVPKSRARVKASMREASGGLTAELLDDLAIGYFGSHRSA